MKNKLFLISGLNIISVFVIGILFLSNTQMENIVFWVLVFLTTISAITAKLILRILKENF